MFVPLATLKLLVVDDQSLVRTAMRHMLMALGAKHITDASSGEEAIELLLKQPFDLVISDIDMAPINGLELLRHIRLGEYGLNRATLFVMLTGVATKEFVAACINLDVNAFLTKPPKKELLMSRLQYALTNPVKLKDKKDYELIVIPELAAPSAPAERVHSTAVASAAKAPQDDSDSKAQVPGMHYIIWSDKFNIGDAQLDEIMQQGARLMNKAYVGRGQVLELSLQDEFVQDCFRFSAERLRELEQTVTGTDAELAKKFGETRLALSATLAKVRLVMQVSPEMVNYEIFTAMKTWWHRELDLLAKYREKKASA